MLKNFTPFSLLSLSSPPQNLVMNYPIPASPQEVVALRQKSVNEELIASAIVGVIQVAHSTGQSLDDLTTEILADDALLDTQQRRWLSEVVAATWEKFSLEEVEK